MFLLIIYLFIILAISLGDNYGSFNFTYGLGDSAWRYSCQTHAVLSKSDYHSGEQAVMLGPTEDESNICSVLREVKGPAKIEFWWKKNDMLNKNTELSFYDNNSKIMTYNYEKYRNEWANETYYITEGTHIIKWQYELQIAGTTCPFAFSWIDDVNITPMGCVKPDCITISPLKITQELPENNNKLNVNNTTNFHTINQGNKSGTRLIEVSDCVTVKQGGNLSDAIEIGKSKHISCVKIMNGDYPLEKPLLLNENSINIIGESREGVKLYPSPQTTGNIIGIKINNDGCIVKNLTLKEFYRCIIVNSSKCLIENNSLEPRQYGITIENGNYNKLIYNKFVQYYYQCSAVYVGNSTFINITENNFSGICGIEFFNTSNSSIIQNYISMDYGIALQKSINTTLEYNNIIISKTRYGISVDLRAQTKRTIIKNNNMYNGIPHDETFPGDNQWQSNYWHGNRCDQPKYIEYNIYDQTPLCRPVMYK